MTRKRFLNKSNAALIANVRNDINSIFRFLKTHFDKIISYPPVVLSYFNVIVEMGKKIRSGIKSKFTKCESMGLGDFNFW